MLIVFQVAPSPAQVTTVDDHNVAREFVLLKALVRTIAQETGAEGRVRYEVGTMMEVPRACLR